MQVVGLCRFSYPALGGFQTEHDSIEKRIDYLYQPKRMEDRFRHFEALALPSLKNQTDQDFTFLIVIGSQMPAVYKSRLAEMIASFPQAQILERDPGPHRAVMQDILLEARQTISGPCLQFRHDDDDAVAASFIERLRRTAQDCRALLKTHPMVAIDFNRGFFATADEEGLQARELVTPYLGVALGLMARAKAKRTIMNFGHHKLNQTMPTVTFTDEPMFLRSLNDHNDSKANLQKRGSNLVPLDGNEERQFRHLFGINTADIRRIFAGQQRSTALSS